MTLHRIAQCQYESPSYDDEATLEKVVSDKTIFEEESDEDYEIFIDDGQISDNESSENEDQDSGRNIG